MFHEQGANERPTAAADSMVLQLIVPMAEQGWPPAQTILRQLEWCRLLLLGLPGEPRPGPFSMGIIATREFDMYGDQPDARRAD